MAKGFTMIVVPHVIEPLLTDPKSWDFVVALYYWLIEELYKELGDELADTEIDVFSMQWFGPAYPAIGIYERPLDSKFEKLLAETSDRLLRERPISDIVDFMKTTGINWKAEASCVMSKSTNYALLYREQVWHAFYPDQPFYEEGNQAEFCRWLEKTHEYARGNLQYPDENSSEFMLKLVEYRRNSGEYKRNLFLSAIGLITYGFLENVPDIVDNFSLVPKELASIMNFIFPLPAGMNVFNNPDEVKTWVHKNSANLYFKESEGVFKLTT